MLTKDLKRSLTKEDIWMVNKHMEKCLTSLVNKAMMRNQHTPTRMAKMKKTAHTKCGQVWSNWNSRLLAVLLNQTWVHSPDMQQRQFIDIRLW